MNSCFPNFSSTQNKPKARQKKNEDQKLCMDSLELKTIEKEVLKELDQISKRHCVQIFPSSVTNNQQLFTRTAYPLKSSQVTISPRQIKYNQDTENQSAVKMRGTMRNSQDQSVQQNQEYEISQRNHSFTKDQNMRNNNAQKRNWISPIIQKQNQYNSQRILLQQRSNKSCINGHKKISFQVQAKCQTIHTLEDKKQQIESTKRQSHLFYNKNQKDENSNHQTICQNKPSQIQRISLNHLCELPSFNSSFRIQRLNTAQSPSNKNIEKIRSFSNTSYSLFGESWIKQEFLKSINSSKSKNNSFDFYFYNDQISKLDNLNTEISLQKNSIDSKR